MYLPHSGELNNLGIVANGKIVCYLTNTLVGN